MLLLSAADGNPLPDVLWLRSKSGDEVDIAGVCGPYYAASGMRLGPYEVIEALGAVGMGESIAQGIHASAAILPSRS